MRDSTAGQVTVFVVLGLVILIAAIMIFYAQSSSIEAELEQPTQVEGFEAVQVYIDACADEVVADAVRLVSVRGGYYTIPEDHINYFYVIPYYYTQEKGSLVPTIDQIQQELALYVNENLPSCTNGFEELKEQGFGISESAPSTTTTIGEQAVTFDIAYPVVAQKGEEQAQFNKISKSVDSRMFEFYTLAQEYVAKQSRDANWVHSSFLSELTYNFDFDYELVYLDNNVIFVFIDRSDETDPYYYSFASQFDWEYLNDPELTKETFENEILP